MTKEDIKLHVIRRKIRILERVYRVLLGAFTISFISMMVFFVKLAITDQGAHGLVVSMVVGLLTMAFIKFIVDKQHEYEILSYYKTPINKYHNI
tara:strand:- start:33 stop:314 length:282 start_codon:yes stop_codon:yes gene_type:complete